MRGRVARGSAGRRPSPPQSAYSVGVTETTIRPATEADLPFIRRVYDAGMDRYRMAAARDEAAWRYELTGHHLASVVARTIRVIASSEARAASMDPWKIKNDRRLDLIHLEFSVGLDFKQEAELEKLQREIYSHMQAIDPRPTESLDEIDARFEKMKERIEAKRGKKGNASGTV